MLNAGKELAAVPTRIRSDNGPEFTAKAIRVWLRRVGVHTLYVEPGAPWENGFAETFHSRFRDEFLETAVFESLSAARKLTAAWKEDYNHHRPLSSLGNPTSAESSPLFCWSGEVAGGVADSNVGVEAGQRT